MLIMLDYHAILLTQSSLVDTPLFRDSPKALEYIDMEKDFFLYSDEVVRAMLALISDDKYASGTILEVGDIDMWHEVQLLNDPGPQGKSTLSRSKAAGAI